jgi:hypothetical protein
MRCFVAALVQLISTPKHYVRHIIIRRSKLLLPWNRRSHGACLLLPEPARRRGRPLGDRNRLTLKHPPAHAEPISRRDPGGDRPSATSTATQRPRRGAPLGPHCRSHAGRFSSSPRARASSPGTRLAPGTKARRRGHGGAHEGFVTIRMDRVGAGRTIALAKALVPIRGSRPAETLEGSSFGRSEQGSLAGT